MVHSHQPTTCTAMSSINLSALRACFPERDISWRPLVHTRDRKRALVVAYLSNRAIMDRLDEVCGPANWRNLFRKGPDGGVICGISIRIDGEWVTKWDGAENTGVQSVKGGLSASMRRAAVQWGVGRYLYRLPRVWVPVDERGRPVRTPSLPPDYRVDPVSSAGRDGQGGDGRETPRLEPYVLVPSESPASKSVVAHPLRAKAS